MMNPKLSLEEMKKIINDFHSKISATEDSGEQKVIISQLLSEIENIDEPSACIIMQTLLNTKKINAQLLVVADGWQEFCVKHKNFVFDDYNALQTFVTENMLQKIFKKTVYNY